MQRTLSIFILLFLVTVRAQAHEVDVHERITKAASDACSGYKSFLSDVFGPDKVRRSDSPIFGNNRNAWGLLEYGSIQEDKEGPVNAQWRTKNHFFDPVTEQGLTSGITGYALSSYLWARAPIEDGGPLDEMRINDYCWAKAREYEKAALTSTSMQERDRNFGLLFRSLGQIMHLLQDCTVPAHVRNDNHGFGDEIFENYGKNNYAKLSYPAAMLDWRSRNFKSIKDFWMSLSLYTQTKFLSRNALYTEMYKKDDIHQYPHPAILDDTDWPQMRDDPEKFKGKITMDWDSDNLWTKTVKITKLNQEGQNEIKFHSGLSKKGLNLAKDGGEIAYNANAINILFPGVNAEYHKNLIPQAIEYSSGLLDYFFRGRIDVGVSQFMFNTYTLRIQNCSGQIFRKGQFTLYADDTEGMRTQITTLATDYNEVLYPGGTVVGSFTVDNVNLYDRMLVVFQGNISPDIASLDPDDTEIAIAAKSFSLCDPANRYSLLNVQEKDVTIGELYECQALATWPLPTVRDCMGGPVDDIEVTCNPPSSTHFAPGRTPVTCYATKNNNTIAACAFYIFVDDGEDPTLTQPESIQAFSWVGNPVSVNYPVMIAHDNCDSSPAVHCFPASGASFPVGTTTVNCYAQDDCGRKSDLYQFNVEVICCECGDPEYPPVLMISMEEEDYVNFANTLSPGISSQYHGVAWDKTFVYDDENIVTYLPPLDSENWTVVEASQEEGISCGGLASNFTLTHNPATESPPCEWRLGWDPHSCVSTIYWIHYGRSPVGEYVLQNWTDQTRPLPHTITIVEADVDE